MKRLVVVGPLSMAKRKYNENLCLRGCESCVAGHSTTQLDLHFWIPSTNQTTVSRHYKIFGQILYKDALAKDEISTEDIESSTKICVGDNDDSFSLLSESLSYMNRRRVLNLENKKVWMPAMQKEVDSLLENQTYVLIGCTNETVILTLECYTKERASRGAA
jgi:hypothetical protein